ncbi:MAG: hypothetical protein LV480_01890 [Methylacidiphilales bacterium]|nr:hypothetical protein [Candidatus Methylacidiphilales bacterium]
MNLEESDGRLEGYLKSLDEEQLDQALNEVLAEMRRRESEQMKQDVLTHSQTLRLRRPLSSPGKVAPK